MGILRWPAIVLPLVHWRAEGVVAAAVVNFRLLGGRVEGSLLWRVCLVAQDVKLAEGQPMCRTLGNSGMAAQMSLSVPGQSAIVCSYGHHATRPSRKTTRRTALRAAQLH